MKKQTSRRRIVLISSAIVFAMCSSRAYSEWKLQGLLNVKERSEALPQFHNAKEMETWMSRAKEHNRRLAQLWMERKQRDITRDVLPFLRDEAPGIRQRAAMMTGRLESKKAEAPLQAMLNQADKPEANSQTSGVSRLMLKLALGRIKSRQLKGQAKLDIIARSTGLSWPEVVRLSQKVNAPRSYASGTEADEVVDEMVDVLYYMGKQGQNLKTWTTQLKLSSAQEVLLRAAPLSPQQEAQILLDFLSHIQLLNEDAYTLIYHLIGLGDQASKATDNYLEKMRNDASDYPQGVNYKAIFIAASGMNRRSAIPLIKQFERSNSAYIISQAQTAQMLIKKQLAVPVFPA